MDFVKNVRLKVLKKLLKTYETYEIFRSKPRERLEKMSVILKFDQYHRYYLS